MTLIGLCWRRRTVVHDQYRLCGQKLSRSARAKFVPARSNAWSARPRRYALWPRTAIDLLLLGRAYFYVYANAPRLPCSFCFVFAGGRRVPDAVRILHASPQSRTGPNQPRFVTAPALQPHRFAQGLCARCVPGHEISFAVLSNQPSDDSIRPINSERSASAVLHGGQSSVVNLLTLDPMNESASTTRSDDPKGGDLTGSEHGPSTINHQQQWRRRRRWPPWKPE